MKASLLLLLACAAALAAASREEPPREPQALLKKMQELAQKTSAAVKSAFSSIRESEGAQLARRWLSDNADLAKERLLWLKERVVELWK
ncbi:APOC3 protein, partial [Upupa epops]|nr:APOC3 protein [Upupa epops]